MSHSHSRTPSTDRRVYRSWSLFERVGLGASIVLIAAQLGWGQLLQAAEPTQTTTEPTAAEVTAAPATATLPAPEASEPPATSAPSEAASPEASEPPATSAPSTAASPEATPPVDATTVATAAAEPSPTLAAPSAPPETTVPSATAAPSPEPTATPPVYARPTVDAETRISISMDASTSRAAPGDDVDFVLVVSNDGGLPAQTRVNSDLAAPFAIIAAASTTGVCEVSGNNVVCSVEVPAQATASVVIRAFVVPSSPPSAAVSSADATGDGWSARAVATVEIAAPAQAPPATPTTPATPSPRDDDNNNNDSDDASVMPTRPAAAMPTNPPPAETTSTQAPAVATNTPLPTSTRAAPMPTSTLPADQPAAAPPDAALPVAAAPIQGQLVTTGGGTLPTAFVAANVVAGAAPQAAMASTLLPNTASGGLRPPLIGLGLFALVLGVRSARLRLRRPRS